VRRRRERREAADAAARDAAEFGDAFLRLRVGEDGRPRWSRVDPRRVVLLGPEPGDEGPVDEAWVGPGPRGPFVRLPSGEGLDPRRVVLLEGPPGAARGDGP